MTRDQRVHTPIQTTSYTVIGASHDQEKLPKYAPIFVAVGFTLFICCNKMPLFSSMIIMFIVPILERDFLKINPTPLQIMF